MTHLPITHLPIKGHKRSSIYLMKVAGALVKLKGINNHSNNPSLVLKFVFHTSMDTIWNWWYLDLRTSFVKNLEPFKLSMSSSIHGRGYLLFTEIFVEPDSWCTCAKCHLSLELRQLYFHKERSWGRYEPCRSNPGFFCESLHFLE